MAVLEVELKLRGDEAALDELAAVPRLGPAILGPPRTVDELDRYLDTAGQALAEARWACRLRTREGRSWISLKGPAEHADGASLHRRPEVEGPAPAAPEAAPATWPHSPARDLVLRLAGADPLHEILRLRQRRVERMAEVNGIRVAVLSLDRVVVEAHGREQGRQRVVELELEPGADRSASDAVVAALRRHPGLLPEPASKLELALAVARGATEAAG
jgi:inorganic triphosphatase YgiF